MRVEVDVEVDPPAAAAAEAAAVLRGSSRPARSAASDLDGRLSGASVRITKQVGGQEGSNVCD